MPFQSASALIDFADLRLKPLASPRMFAHNAVQHIITVIPAKAGISLSAQVQASPEIPAYAGMTTYF